MTHVTLVALLKGGARKSTTAMLTAFGLAREPLSRDVLVVDADAGTQGVTDWTTRVYNAGGDMPFDVAQWSPEIGPLAMFAREHISRIAGEAPDHVLIDVGGEAPGVVKEAAAIADRVIIPLGPEHAEISRLAPTVKLLQDARPGLPVGVLLTRVPVVGAGAAREVRDVLTVDGYTVLPIEIGRNLTMYADVWGTVPAELGAYAHLAAWLDAVAYRAPVEVTR